jgi:signal-transduction protein with cAMP-binding, CBS, and nucleotidyltransferase domain
MSEARHYLKPVVTVPTGVPVSEVAEILATKAVGCAIVVDDDGRPLGLVTDRDLMSRVIARGRESGPTPARAVMSHPLITATPTDPLDTVVALMMEHGVRRLPIVENGSELRDLGDVARREIRSAQRTERLRALRADLESAVRRSLESAEALGARAESALAEELESIRDALHKRFS